MIVLNNFDTSANLNLNEFFNSLNEYFSKETKKFPFQKSSAGSTGVTFLPLDYNFEWVVKWQDRSHSEIEYLCTKFYQRSFIHLSVPKTIYGVPEELVVKMRKYFPSQYIAPHYVPIIMQYRNGNNLNKICENKNIFMISNEELQKVFFYFGEVSGYDFLIANCDRFIPKEFCGQLLDNHSSNGGNILIELEVPTGLESKQFSGCLKTVHLIDNTLHFDSFFTYNEWKMENDSNQSESILEDCLSLFDDQDSTKKITTPRFDKQIHKTGQHLRDNRFHDFKYFIQSTPSQLELLASQISIGIKNEWKRTNMEQIQEIVDFFENKEKAQAIHQGLYAGLLKAQKNIKDPKLQSVLNELKKEVSSFTTSTQTVISFIEKNLKFAQN